MRRVKSARLLVVGAGSGPANNLIRSLRAAKSGWAILGANHDPFALSRSAADRSFLIPSADDAGFVRALRRLAASERVDLVIPTADAEVVRLASARRGWPCHLFLPSARTVALCQDKYVLTRHLGARGVPVPRTLPLSGVRSVGEAYRRLGRPRRAWCRIRRGTNASGAVPVATAEQARNWIAYWETMRRVPASTFTLSEYLPGRDFACQSLWQRGRLVLVKVFERLAYISVGGNPSGMSSAAALARTVAEPRVVEVAIRTVRAVDPRASGVFGVDLKENARGEACVTEINAGRFLAGTNLLDFTGAHNMAATYVKLGMGEAVAIKEVHDASADHYMVRSVDEYPRIVHKAALCSTTCTMPANKRPSSRPPTRGKGGRHAERARPERGDSQGHRRDPGPSDQGKAGQISQGPQGAGQDRPRKGRGEAPPPEELLGRGSAPWAPAWGRSAARVPTVEITARLDAHGLEALRLQIHRLAAGYGIALRRVDAERTDRRRSAP
jgi:hypothetical protein